MWQKYINRKFMGTRLAGESKKQTSTSLAEAGEVTAELCGPARGCWRRWWTEMGLVEGDIRTWGVVSVPVGVCVCVCVYCRHLSMKFPPRGGEYCSQTLHLIFIFQFVTNLFLQLSTKCKHKHARYSSCLHQSPKASLHPPCSTSLT